MWKKVVSMLLAVAVLAMMPLIAGCEKDEIKTHRHVEVKDQVVEQKTIVR